MRIVKPRATTKIIKLRGIAKKSILDIKWNHKKHSVRNHFRGFPSGAVVESLPANAGDTGSSPGLGRSHMPRSN